MRHPRSLAARLVRKARFLDSVRGWRRIVRAFVPADPELTYVIRNEGMWFAGDLGSYIEREAYLFGGYESSAIDVFLRAIPKSRRRVAMDVGANVGTHTLRFAQAFATVHSFEPNPKVFPRLRANIALNGLQHVHLHPIGLGDRTDILPFHDIGSANAGLGTFSTIEQYDRKLEVAGQARIEPADDYLTPLLDGPVDAVKIDVQGFEPQVLIGMRKILEAHKPFLWFEVSEATRHSFHARQDLRELIPYEFSLRRFESGQAGLRNRMRLTDVEKEVLDVGDYLAVPA